jgi:hypothetical protein
MSGQREPTFLLGGTSAGGTSFLSALLLQHPEVYMPREMRPEPHFFFKSWEYDRGVSYYLNRWFDNVPTSAVAIGERSSSYLYGGSGTASKIVRHLPSVKMVFVLRDPVQRAWANYRYTVLEGLEDLDFESALASEKDRVVAASGIWSEIQPHDYTGRGFYGRQLLGFLEHIDRSSIHVIKSEHLRDDTEATLADVCSFLGVDRTLAGTLERPSDYTSVSVINPRVQAEARSMLHNRFDLIVEAVRDGSDPFRFSESPDDDAVVASLTGNLTNRKLQIPRAARSLLQEMYEDDLLLLSSLVDFDLSDWMK